MFSLKTYLPSVSAGFSNAWRQQKKIFSTINQFQL